MKHSTEGKQLRDDIYQADGDKKQKRADIQVRKAQLELAGKEAESNDDEEEVDADGQTIYKNH